jgi:calcineurin-like phosphoesterase family protein
MTGKVQRFDPLKTWLTADLHLGHANIIRFLDRPFRGADGKPDVERMDQALISNWDAEVEDDHDVFIVGDFAYKCHPRKLNGYFHALKGRKHLVPGNHDSEQTLRLPWASRVEHLREIDIGDLRVVLCHYALRTWPKIGKGALHVYGHSHGRLPPTGNSIDVGVDVFGMRPVRIDEVLRKLAAWPRNQVRPIERDHHAPSEDDDA